VRQLEDRRILASHRNDRAHAGRHMYGAQHLGDCFYFEWRMELLGKQLSVNSRKGYGSERAGILTPDSSQDILQKLASFFVNQAKMP
jgi:hypothetical protein